MHFWLDITEVFETKWDINISPISSATLDSWSSWSDPVHIPGARSQPPLFWQENLNPWPVGLVFSTGRGGPVGILPTWDLLRVLRGRRRPTTPNPPTCPKHRDWRLDFGKKTPQNYFLPLHRTRPFFSWDNMNLIISISNFPGIDTSAQVIPSSFFFPDEGYRIWGLYRHPYVKEMEQGVPSTSHSCNQTRQTITAEKVSCKM